MGGMEMKSDKKAKSQTHHASGNVTKVDAQKSSVTIAHGPVQSMNWPAMSMTFKVKDKKMLDNVKQGEKVEFDFINRGKDHVITKIQ
jgi:Cu(I)/Ag(I) efflux system periplasmic protein CusF